MQSLRDFLAAWPEVEEVKLDTEWLQRLNAILDLLRGVVTGASVLLVDPETRGISSRPPIRSSAGCTRP